MRKKQKKATGCGFTIVELLIVIVLVGILTTLTVVVYGGIQARTRDTIVKNAAKQFGTQLQRFSSDTGKTPIQTGGGWSRNGIGFVSTQYVDPTNYPVAIETVLVSGGYLPKDFTAGLPKNTKYNSSAFTLMLYACGSKYTVYYSLEAPTDEDVADFNIVKSQCGGTATTVEANYNMKGGYIFS